MNFDKNLSQYIQNQCPDMSDFELGDILKQIKSNTDSLIKKFNDKVADIRDIALELSNFKEAIDFLSTVPDYDLERYKSIDWNSFQQVDKDTMTWNTSSGKSPAELKAIFKNAVRSENVELFSKTLSQVLELSENDIKNIENEI